MPKISSLPVATDVTTDDYVVIVNSPGGTPSTQRATIGDITMLAVENMQGISWEGTWNIGTSYAAADVVSYDGSVYIALRSTIGDQPDISTSDWQLWVAQGPVGGAGGQGIQGDPGDFGIPKVWLDTGYDAGTTYTRGDAIEHAGNTWVCVVETVSGDEPTLSSENWQRILVKGSKTWGATSPWVTATAYSSGGDYEPADAVVVDGSTYYCVVDHTSGDFGDDLSANKWAVIALRGEQGVVATVSSTDSFIVVDDGDPANPSLSLDTTELAADTGFVAAVAGEVQANDFAPSVVATTNAATVASTSAWVTLDHFAKVWPTGAPAVGSISSSSFTPGAEGLWRVTINLLWPWPMTGAYAFTALYGYEGGTVMEKHTVGSHSPGPNGWICDSVTFPVVVTADAVSNSRNYRIKVKHATGSNITFPAAAATISWEYVSTVAGIEPANTLEVGAQA